MTKLTTYVCDVCGTSHDKPIPLHLIAMYKKETVNADCCKETCATAFAEKAFAAAQEKK